MIHLLSEGDVVERTPEFAYGLLAPFAASSKERLRQMPQNVQDLFDSVKFWRGPNGVSLVRMFESDGVRGSLEATRGTCVLVRSVFLLYNRARSNSSPSKTHQFDSFDISNASRD